MYISMIICDARRMGLDLGAMADMTPDEVARSYNGVGPDRWPECVRRKLDAMAVDYAPAVCIHDCDFTRSDGTEGALREATRRFRRNTARIYRRLWPLLSWEMVRPSYRRRRACSLAVRKALDLGVAPMFSRRAWQEAHLARGGEA